MPSLACALEQIDRAIAGGPFDADWRSLEAYRVPAWYPDAKFGVFIHWGPYCVPAFGNEWYPRNMYDAASSVHRHHIEAWGHPCTFGYKDFIAEFKAERFHPSEWADLFRRAGARYVVPVAEHHDGFAMYDDGFGKWNAVEMGPRRDVVGELAQAAREEGLVFGLSSHRAEHWWFFHEGTKYPSDVQAGKYADLYGPARPRDSQPDQAFLDEWLGRTCELVDKYEPAIVWFDWWIEQPAFEPALRRFAAYYYNRAAEWEHGAAINYKNRAFPAGSAVYDIERGQTADIHPLFWQTDTSVSRNSWGYITHHEYKTSGSLVGDLVDIVSKNGALLLNIGPRPEGTIPEPEEEMLLDIGRWLEINGEAIYETRPWKTCGEGPTAVAAGQHQEKKNVPFTAGDIRFTRKGDTIYAILLGWPEDRDLRIASLAQGAVTAPSAIAGVSMLGSKAKIEWKQDGEALRARLPARRPCDHAWTLKIACE